MLLSEDLAHGVVEGQLQDFHAEVDGVAGEVISEPFEDAAGFDGPGSNCLMRLCNSSFHVRIVCLLGTPAK